MIEVRIGSFIREHLNNIVGYCSNNIEELNNLQTREYSRDDIGLYSNYTFLSLTNMIHDTARYWSKIYTINNNEYRFCSQFGGSEMTNGQTRSQREGTVFLDFLKRKDLLLEKYKNEDIKFIVGKTKGPIPIDIEILKEVINSYTENKKVKYYFTLKSNPQAKYPRRHIVNEAAKRQGLNKEFNTNQAKDILSELFGEDIIFGDTSNIKNIILYGAPGVGKTHNTSKLISLIESGQDEEEIFNTIKENKDETIALDDDVKSRTKFITFHQSFGYEDFIEGFRPNEDGNIVLTDGVFKKICKEADEDRDNNYYLVIDEINRGNISKIFGELITLIEEDKRDNLEVTLPYSRETFKIPSNLYIIGTMNSTDKSIALIDIALRRRFTFLKMKPNENLVPDIARDIFIHLNETITNDLGEDYQIGHSYFMNIHNEEDLDFVLEYKIRPLLEEYYYGDKDGFENINGIITNNINQGE